MRDEYDNILPDMWELDDSEKKDYTIYATKELLKEILSQLYSTAPIDANKLESNLEEICHLLEIRLDFSDIQIERKKQSLPSYLNEWIIFNNQYLKSITKQERAQWN